MNALRLATLLCIVASCGRPPSPEDARHRGTLAWAFKDAGYTTALFGKWHLGEVEPDVPPFGFDRSIVWSGTNNHRESRFSVDGGYVVDWRGASNATATVDQALEWIAEVSGGDRPFFVLVALNPPHRPFHDAPEDKQRPYPEPETLPFHPLDEVRDWDSHRDYPRSSAAWTTTSGG